LLVALLLAVAGAGDAPANNFSLRLDNAWTAFSLEEFKTARDGFSALLDEAAGGSEEQLSAMFGLATTFAQQRPEPDLPRARELFEKLAKSSNQEFSAWSLLAMARLEHVVPVGKDPDYPKLSAAYQRVIDRFPSHPASEEAFIFLESTLVATLDPAKASTALKNLDRFVATHPSSKFSSAAHALMAECRQTLKQPDQRLAEEIAALDTVEVDPAAPYADKAYSYWKIASIAEFEVGDLETARKYYRLLIQEYPTDQRLYGAKAALQRMTELETKLSKKR
jgi:outer membrane protein assembly factor BamD (BamD/ComL family)